MWKSSFVGKKVQLRMNAHFILFLLLSLLQLTGIHGHKREDVLGCRFPVQRTQQKYVPRTRIYPEQVGIAFLQEVTNLIVVGRCICIISLDLGTKIDIFILKTLRWNKIAKLCFIFKKIMITKGNDYHLFVSETQKSKSTRWINQIKTNWKRFYNKNV